MQARDARFDERLVYGVTSTGICCLPSCPSRRPLRRNAVFFPDVAAARRAGFRACRRCQPDGQRPALRAVRRALEFVEAHLDEAIRLSEVAAAAGMSAWHLQRVFKREVGVTPREYGAAARARAFKRRSRQRDSVTAAIYEVGYGSASRFYEQALTRLGMTPARYRRGGQGAEIRFAVTACPPAALLVAATHSGVCSVRRGACAARLEAELRSEYPGARLLRDDAGLGSWAADVLQRLGRPMLRAALPPHVEETVLEWRLSKALRQGRRDAPAA